MSNLLGLGAVAGVALATVSPAAAASDQEIVSQLDLAYQAAVKVNDAETMDRILHPQMVLARGDGTVVNRAAFIEAARNKTVVYEVQDEVPGTQTVRVWGDTAVVTALLHIIGRQDDRRFEHRIWFSDTYVRTEQGWRYVFAQVSMPLPND